MTQDDRFTLALAGATLASMLVFALLVGVFAS
jgi:hypothetical protein